MLVALNAVLALAISLAVAWLASMLLPLRHPVAFWAVTVSQFPVSLLKNSVSLDIVPVNIFFFVLYFAVAPFLFWRAGRAIRAICAVLILALVIALEVLLTVVYTKLGYTVGALSLGDSVYIVLMRIVYIGVLIVASAVLSPHTRRLAHAMPATGRLGTVYVAILLLLVAQLLALMYAPAFGHVQDYRAHLKLLPAAAVSFAATLFGLRSFTRSVRSRAQQRRARELEERLEVHLALMRDEIAAAASVARFRHDQRNHLTAVARLVDAGRVDEARRYVDELKRAIEDGGVS